MSVLLHMVPEFLFLVKFIAFSTCQVKILRFVKIFIVWKREAEARLNRLSHFTCL